MPERRNIVRVLAIKAGEDKDAEGREYGDDWPLADFGAETDEVDVVHYFLTTNCLHGDEVPDFLRPGQLARLMAAYINRYQDEIARKVREVMEKEKEHEPV